MRSTRQRRVLEAGEHARPGDARLVGDREVTSASVEGVRPRLSLFPEPDLPPLHVRARCVVEPRAAACRNRPQRANSASVTQVRLSAYARAVLTAERETADYFERAVCGVIRRAGGRRSPTRRNGRSPATAQRIGQTPSQRRHLTSLPTELARIADLVGRAGDQSRGRKAGHRLDVRAGEGAEAIVERLGLRQLSSGERRVEWRCVCGYMARESAVVADYRNGEGDGPRTSGWARRMKAARAAGANPRRRYAGAPCTAAARLIRASPDASSRPSVLVHYILRSRAISSVG